MAHELDRPVWHALTTRHAALAVGDARAVRYAPAVSQFAAAPDGGPASVAALAALAAPGDGLIFMQAEAPPRLPGFEVLVADAAVQMVGDAVAEPPDDPLIVALCETDAPEMLELALLTKPGPFTLKSLALGRFWGVRENGRLIAMAGERLGFPGHTELSGLCTHPDHRGRGLGRALLTFVSARIRESGDLPFLHAWASNTGAIALYETMGYRHRAMLRIAFVRRPAEG